MKLFIIALVLLGGLAAAGEHVENLRHEELRGAERVSHCLLL